MEDINANIFSGFGLKIEKFKKSRNGTGIYTGDKKVIVIKASNVSRERLLFSHNVKEKLYESGINTDRYLCCVNGKPFIEANGSVYTAIECRWLDHTDCDLSNRAYVQLAIETLCSMHEALKNTVLPEGCATDCRMTKWHDYYVKRKKELSHIKKWVLKQSCMSRMDIIFLRNYDMAVEAAERGILLTSSDVFKKMLNKVTADRLICHNQYRDDILRIKGDDIIITEFEESGYNHPIVDLREIIRRYIKTAEPNAAAVYSAINLYAKHYALSDEELAFLPELMMIPDKYLQIINRYYNKRRTWVSHNIIKYAENTLVQQHKQNQLLQEIISSVSL